MSTRHMHAMKAWYTYVQIVHCVGWTSLCKCNGPGAGIFPYSFCYRPTRWQGLWWTGLKLSIGLSALVASIVPLSWQYTHMLCSARQAPKANRPICSLCLNYAIDKYDKSNGFHKPFLTHEFHVDYGLTTQHSSQFGIAGLNRNFLTQPSFVVYIQSLVHISLVKCGFAFKPQVLFAGKPLSTINVLNGKAN